MAQARAEHTAHDAVSNPAGVDDLLSTVAGWIVLVSAVTQLALRNGAFIHAEYLTAATILSLISIAFLFLLRPRLGSYFEWTGVVSALLVFLTLIAGFTHILANQGDWPLARLWGWFQSMMQGVIGQLGGEGLAAFSTSPLYLMGAFILILSFAYKSYVGFVVFIGCFLLYGLYPWNLGILTAYLLWFAGFALLQREVLYLPRALEERLHLDAAARDLLLEIRQRPLADHEVRFYLEGPGAAAREGLSPVARQTLTALGDAGLLEYSPVSGRVHAGSALESSFLPAPVAVFVETASWVASWLLLAIAGVYFMIPVDFLPEVLLGPVGIVDDLVLLAVGALPIGGKLWDRAGQFLGRGKAPRP